MSQEMEEYVDVEVIVIPQDDGSEVEYTIMDEFNLNGKDYMILSPSVDGVFGGTIEYYSMEEEDDDMMMEEIEDEKELESVRDFFSKRMKR